MPNLNRPALLRQYLRVLHRAMLADDAAFDGRAEALHAEAAALLKQYKAAGGTPPKPGKGTR